MCSIIVMITCLAFSSGYNKIRLVEQGTLKERKIKYFVYKFNKEIMSKQDLEFLITRRGSLKINDLLIPSPQKDIVLKNPIEIEDWYEHTEKKYVKVIQSDNGTKIFSTTEILGSGCVDCVPILTVDDLRFVVLPPRNPWNPDPKSWKFIMVNGQNINQLPVNKISWKGFWEFGWSYASLAAFIDISGTVYIVTTNGYALVISYGLHCMKDRNKVVYGEKGDLSESVKEYVSSISDQ